MILTLHKCTYKSVHWFRAENERIAYSKIHLNVYNTKSIARNRVNLITVTISEKRPTILWRDLLGK